MVFVLSIIFILTSYPCGIDLYKLDVTSSLLITCIPANTSTTMTTVPLFVLLSLAVTIVSAAIEYAPVVEIKQGKVIGVVEKAEHGRKVYHYNSIRYGELWWCMQT